MSLDVRKDIKKAMSDAKTDQRRKALNKYDILPGDKVEIKFVGHVTEVQMNDQDDYILIIEFDEGPKKYDPMMINMKNINSIYIRKFQYDDFLGDFV